MQGQDPPTSSWGGNRPSLVRPSQSEHERTFERLFQRYCRPLRAFFSNRGFSPEDCRDLTQETFLAVHKGLGRYRGDASEETWLFSIAANVWRTRLRRKSTGKRLGTEVSMTLMAEEGQELPPERGSSADPLGDILREERAILLKQAIEELPVQMRRCVFLRIEQDMKYREIAVIMQISIDTVKSQLFQARARLRKQLGDYFDDLKL